MKSAAGSGLPSSQPASLHRARSAAMGGPDKIQGRGGGADCAWIGL